MENYKFSIVNKDYQYKNNLEKDLGNCYAVVAKFRKNFAPLARILGLTPEVLYEWAMRYNGYGAGKDKYYTYYVTIRFQKKEDAEKFLQEIVEPRFKLYKTSKYPSYDVLQDSSLPLDYLPSDYRVDVGALKEIKGLAKIINAQYNHNDFADVYVGKIVGNRVALVPSSDTNKAINLVIGVDQWIFKTMAEVAGARWIRYGVPAYEFKTLEEAEKFLMETIVPRWEVYKKTSQRIFSEQCPCGIQK